MCDVDGSGLPIDTRNGPDRREHVDGSLPRGSEALRDLLCGIGAGFDGEAP